MTRTWFVAAASAALLAAGLGPATQAAIPAAGGWGFDVAGENPAVRPGDDFNQYANGTYLDHLTIPPDQRGYGSFNKLRDLSEIRVRAILEDAARSSSQSPDSAEAKIGAAWRAFMDEARVESLGARPLAGDLARVRALRDKAELARFMGEGAGSLNASVFGVGIGPDDKAPTRYAVALGQDGLGLPDRDYYLTPGFAAKKAAYEAYVARLLGLIGWSDPQGAARAVVALETQIAAASWSKAQMRDPDAIYNPMSIAELSALAPGFDWVAFMSGAGLQGEDRVIIDARSAFPKLAAIVAETPLETFKAFEAFHLADAASPYLSSAFTTARFEFRDKVLGGQEAQRPRWKRAVSEVDRVLGEDVGRVYVARYFPPSSKAEMETLIANLRRALGRRIEALSWMGPQTKAEALKKLRNFDVQVGYPKKWRDYSGLKISDADLYGDVVRSLAFEWDYQRGRLHAPVDKDEWLMTPQTVNAYNNPVFNEVVFPAAILQPPFFDPAADPAVNYGAIGAVIGHEMTHGFDDEGRKYDAEGRLRDWWTPADAAAFEQRARALGASYEALAVLPGAHINGALTMGENIADLGGILTALDAYHASLGGRPAPVIDGLTGDQRFFLGFAQIWRAKTRDDALRQQLVADPHSPPSARLDGVLPNVDDWYAAFGVTPSDRMYRAPEARTRIW